MMMGLPSYYTFECEEDTPKVKNLDDWLRSCGAIRCKRAEDQSLNEYYLTSALINETINHNQVTMLYQNSRRLLSGKIDRNQGADISVKWLFESFINLRE